MNPSSTRVLSRPDAVNVDHVVDRCRVLGPGERFVVWVQGCPLRCPGCHNPAFQPFADNLWIPVDDLADRALATSGIEGVTYVGGEPFSQARALAALSRRVRSAGLSVMVFSGFTLAELRSGAVPFAGDLLDAADLLMDGRYERGMPTAKPWRGSDNQRLVSLSDRYAAEVDAWNRPVGQTFELRLSADGAVEALGIPPGDLGQAETNAFNGKVARDG